MATIASKSVDIGTLISKPPHLHEGRPVIAGMALLVRSIVMDHKQNISSEEIASERYITLAQVHAALAYYYANQKEIESDIVAYHEEYERAEKKWLKMRAEGRA